jgi:hypothetical protein
MTHGAAQHLSVTLNKGKQRLPDFSKCRLEEFCSTQNPEILNPPVEVGN